MQAAPERRTQDDDRVPLDALIELTHSEGSEVLEADAVDVSTGGLSLRASFMPPVGARMQCRFACPPRGDRVVADCEVVWSAWEGAQAGAFGVRFLALDTRSATLIRRLLEPDNECVREALEELCPRPTLVPQQAPSTVANLHIDGLGSPIEADVQLDEDDHVLLKQELAFLRLGRAVRVEIEGAPSRRGRIASVMLEQSPSDVPALSLGVLIDAEPADAAPRASAAEVAHDPEPSFAPPDEADATPELGPMDTWPESPTFTVQPRAQVPATEEALAGAEAPTSEPSLVRSLRSVSAPTAVDADAFERPVRETAISVQRTDERPAAQDEDDGMARARAATLQTAGRAGELAQGAWGNLRPKLMQLVARAQAELGNRAPRYRDGVMALWSLLRDWLGNQVGRLKHVRRSQKKRRTTAPAPRAAAAQGRRVGRSSEAVKPAASGRGRLVLVGVLAFAGVAGAIYALAPRRSQSALELHRRVAPVPAQGVAVPANATPQAAQPLASPPAVEPAAEADVTTPEAETVQAEAGGLSFGEAEVPNGRTYTLRMSGPIERIEGEPRRGGFMVRVPGRLSLDRASPIATSHPALSRSLVLNQGDRAELTIEFVRGKQPKYRVEAKGNSLEITVERL